MPVETRKLTAKSFFSRHGVLSEWHPQFEFRPGQLEMAEAVEAALKQKRHLIVEAGTGIGKTLAYLIPAILADKRVVVSTGTKSLQEQLFFKDIPFLQKHIDRDLKVAYMKGRNNYACRQKIYDAEREAFLTGLEEITDFQIIREWAKTTETGDRAEIRNLPPGSSAWTKVDARKDLCVGQQCPNYDRCFITKMMIKARESDLVIVNHHLFFADLSLRGDDRAGVIPEYDAVIFDEAHEVESVAGTYFGASVSTFMIHELRRDVSTLARRKEFAASELDATLQSLVDASMRFFDCLPVQEGRTGVANQRELMNDHATEFADLQHTLELTTADLKLAKGAPEESGPLIRRTEEIAGRLRSWMRGDDPRFVYWMERRAGGVILEATPISVGDILRDRLFGTVSTVVLTSATLAVAGSFEYIKNRLGIHDARSSVVTPTFDFRSQAILYVPQQLPDPRSPAFLDAAVEETIELIEISRGRAFVLFTSNQQMRQFHDRIAYKVDYTCLLQGTGPNHALLEEFKRTPNCVLFATASFWQGIDVPGEQLSCVIIDRLPFAVPSDPVVDARVRSIRDAGGNPFFDYQVPEAAISLKQGFGRLIRTKTDRGILALLDNRITRQRYGQIFFDSLPDYEFTLDRDGLKRFLENV